MPTLHDLIRSLQAIDGQGYGHYKRLRGTYDAGFFHLHIDHVQGDPYAVPSRLRAVLPPESGNLPAWSYSTPDRRRATADFLNRKLYRTLEECSSRRGSGRSGEFWVLRPSQEVLVRSSLLVMPHGKVEARFRAGLPARGRRILGREAAEMLAQDVVRAIRQALVFDEADAVSLRLHVETVEDACALRAALRDRNLIGFVADGALLPRHSGVDDRPLSSAHTVRFRGPTTLQVTLQTPNAGAIHGMGVRAGITLIVGGGYHGKSTLLRALERGVYDHIPGDGRERVVAVPEAVKVRAEDGRAVAGADISNFIDGLPGGQDTRRFESANASGSTSQAAAIVEALEVGATCLLLDEDTSATNFMIRDARMQALVPDALEPITPFLDRARQLSAEIGISTVLVVGGSGDYFDVADTVIAMRAYLPADVSKEAHRIAAERPTERAREGGDWRPLRRRAPLPESLDPSRGRKAVSIKTFTQERVQFGELEVDLAAVEQIVEPAQTRAIAEALAWAKRRAFNGERPVQDALRVVMETIVRDGLDAVPSQPMGDLAEFRIFELAAFLNRIRGLQIR